MVDGRTPFLDCALEWVYGGEPPEVCPTCGWNWSASPTDALAAIAAAPSRYAELLDDRDGMIAAADGGWNATAYIWHLTDLARSWSERWVQVQATPGSLVAGWDPDVLAEARNYRALPTSAAMWAFGEAVTSFVARCGHVDVVATFEHGEWGTGSVADGIRWLGHEFVHHQLDVDERAGPRTRHEAGQRTDPKVVAGAVIVPGECGEDDVTAANLEQMADTLAIRPPTDDDRRELVNLLRWLARFVRQVDASSGDDQLRG